MLLLVLVLKLVAGDVVNGSVAAEAVDDAVADSVAGGSRCCF